MNNSAPFPSGPLPSEPCPGLFSQAVCLARTAPSPHMPAFLYALLCALLLQLSACAPQLVELPEYGSLKLGVVPFTQPLKSTDLMAGYIPENQALLSPEELTGLDKELQGLLASSTVNLTFLSPDQLALQAENKKGLNSALSRWVALGRAHGVDLVLVPQLLSWDQPNDSLVNLALDFFLVDARDIKNAGAPEQSKVSPTPGFALPQVRESRNALLQRWHFAEAAPLNKNAPKQSLPGYLVREQSLDSVQSLATQAMLKALKELGL